MLYLASYYKVLPALAVVLLIVIFIVECLMPPGVTASSLYVVVVLLMLYQPPRTISIIAVVCSLLALGVPMLLQQEGDVQIIYLSRGITVLAIAMVAVAVSEFDLYRKEVQNNLDQQISDRLREEENNQLQEYMEMASHNLKEPLQTITDNVSELRKEKSKSFDADTARQFGFIEAAAGRLKRRVTRLMGYYHLEDNHIMQRVDTLTLVKSIKAELEPRLKEANARLIIADTLPVVTAMQDKLRQLYWEILDNALKFQRPGTPPVIKVDCTDEYLEWKFCISDNGIGIPPEKQDKIMGLFNHLAPNEAYSGKGVGLALSARITDLHLGKMWVESEPGTGSRFYFTIMKSPV